MPKQRRIYVGNHPKPVRGAAYHTKRVQKKIAENKEEFAKKNYDNLTREKGIGRLPWIKHRGYDRYNVFFKKVIKIDLVDLAKKIPREKNQSLEILDEGAGEGNFLSEIKFKLAEEGIKSNTTAISLRPNKDLTQKRIIESVNSVYLGQAENYFPKKKYDLIFSLYGSIHYTPNFLKKDHLLKYAHSLKKSGAMLIGFDFYDQLGSRFQLKEIEKGFAKRGFQAKLVNANPPSGLMLPKYILFVRRTNKPITKKGNRK